MARSKSFFGLRRGSTKSQTFQVLNGVQITKDRVYEVRNPKTEKQYYQRLVFATVSSAAKNLKKIINHSFEGKAYGEESIRHFRSINMNKLRNLASAEYLNPMGDGNSRVWLTKTKVSQLIPNPYIISDGSLVKPAIEVQMDTASADLVLTVPEINIPARTKPDGSKYITYADVLSYFLGVRGVNEQLTIVLLQRANEGGADPGLYAYTFEQDAPGEAIAYTTFTALRAFVDANVDLSQEVVLYANGEIIENAINAVSNAVRACFTSTETDDKMIEVITKLLRGSDIYYDNVDKFVYDGSREPISRLFEDRLSQGHVYAGGFIRSKLEDGKWFRSRCELAVNKPTVNWNFGLAPGIAYAAEQEAVQLGSDDRFLNGGGEEDQIG